MSVKDVNSGQELDGDINRSTGEFEKRREEQRVEFSELVKKLVRRVRGDRVPVPDHMSFGK